MFLEASFFPSFNRAEPSLVKEESATNCHWALGLRVGVVAKSSTFWGRFHSTSHKTVPGSWAGTASPALKNCALFLANGLQPFTAITFWQALSLHLPVELVQQVVNSKKCGIRVAAVCDRENQWSTIINKLCFPSHLSVSNQTPAFWGYYYYCYYYFIEVDTKCDLLLVCSPVSFTLSLAAMPQVVALLISFFFPLSVSDFPVVCCSCPGWKESSVFLDE